MKRLITYCLLLVAYLTAGAQDISLQVEYPSVVEAGQQFTISWAVNTSGGDFTAPSFIGFYKLMGPQTSYSSSTQIINGKFTHETSYSYVYYLQAIQAGKFVIPPASYSIKNKTYYSDSLHIEVVGSVQQGKTFSREPQLPRKGTPKLKQPAIFSLILT